MSKGQEFIDLSLAEIKADSNSPSPFLVLPIRSHADVVKLLAEKKS